MISINWIVHALSLARLGKWIAIGGDCASALIVDLSWVESAPNLEAKAPGGADVPTDDDAGASSSIPGIGGMTLAPILQEIDHGPNGVRRVCVHTAVLSSCHPLISPFPHHRCLLCLSQRMVQYWQLVVRMAE